MHKQINNDQSIDWKPTATIEMLEFRALIIDKIRNFFKKRNVLEVDTPLLMSAPVTDPYIETFCLDTIDGKKYLQSSPEYAMKRLLASKSGSIYQIAKAFRHEQQSLKHRQEFTMLEWYRVGFDHFKLMDEIKSLLLDLSSNIKFQMVTYQELFETILAINPHTESLEKLQQLVLEKIGKIQGLEEVTRYHALELLFSYCIEPVLDFDSFYFVYHYTKAQGALSRLIETEEGLVAARFECFYKGFELANGYYELTDEIEQKKRFESDLKIRKEEGKKIVPVDDALLNALVSGLPECAGVAIGLDRLIMTLADIKEIKDVISFG